MSEGCRGKCRCLWGRSWICFNSRHRRGVSPHFLDVCGLKTKCFLKPSTLSRGVASLARCLLRPYWSPCIHLSLRRSVCSFVCPGVCPTIHLSVPSSFRSSARPSARSSIRPFVCLSVLPSVRPSMRQLLVCGVGSVRSMHLLRVPPCPCVNVSLHL